MNFRYYIRYRNGYISTDNGHNVQFEASGDGECKSALKFQLSTFNGFSYYPYGGAGCQTGTERVDSINLPANLGQATTLLSNRWYLIEVQGIMDTSCTDNTLWNGCDGQVRVWIDGVKVTEYTNLNMGGSTHNMRWGWRMLAPETYYHYGAPPWSFEIDWDNIAVSNNGTYIGPAEGENARGTGDASSPYRNMVPYGAWLGRHAGDDCTTSGWGEYFWYQYRGSGALCPGDPLACTGSEPAHGRFLSSCPSTTLAGITGSGTPNANGTLATISDGTNGANGTACTGGGSTTRQCVYSAGSYLFTAVTDNALRAQITSSSGGSGAYYERGETIAWPQYVSYGWVYLPSSNNYSVTNLALSGFTNASSDPTQGYVAFSVSGGHWSVDQKASNGTHGALTSGVTATLDTWHEYELILWNNGSGGCANANGCASLMIDRTRIYAVQALPQSAAWAFSGSTTRPYSVVGVIDFQGTPTFTAYFDDSVVTTASAWSGDGWGSSNPFGGGATFSRGVQLGRGVKVQ